MKRINFFNGLIMLVGLALLFSCNQRQSTKPQQFNPEFGNYIYAYTTGVISSHAAIVIKLQHDVNLPDVNSGDMLEMDLFKFDPKISGETYLDDIRTIRFVPDEPLLSKQQYEGSFALGKVMEVEKDLASFDFQFSIIAQSFSVSKTGFGLYDNKDLAHYFINGFVTTADVMDEPDVMKLLRARQGKLELPIRWVMKGYTKKFDFIVDSVLRTDPIEPVVISWDGDLLNLDITGTDTTRIPAPGDFKVVEVNVIQQPEQYIQLQFSDPLMESQNLDGIVHVDGDMKLKFEIKNNTVKAFPEKRISGSETVRVETGIKNLLGSKMNKAFFMNLSFEDIKPAVRMIGKGVILPGSDGLIFPFEAVNLSAVDIRIIKIFENNISQFLQVNQIDGNNEIKRVARPLLTKKIDLNVNPALDAGSWNAYSIDLAELIKDDPGAMYQVEISFKKAYSLFNCGEEKTDNVENVHAEESNSYSEDWDRGGYYYHYYYPPGYDWRERDNPCHVSYYNSDQWVSRNVLASNIGIIAKAGEDGQLKVAVTDIRTTEPLSGIRVEIFNYQQQKIGEASTNANGMADIPLNKKPWLLVANNGNEKGYLRLDDGSSLSLSMFDVSGKVVQEGVKGFLYGERGVWRPGDTLFLNFILEDKNQNLPAGHPVTFELKNPQGQLIKRIVKTQGLNGFYNFTTTTSDEAPTGIWTAKVSVGSASFYKNIRIETVKPNRLKLNLDFDRDMLSYATRNTPGKLTVKWLHGAVAKNLKARVMVTLNPIATRFEGYKDYTFDDRTKTFYADEVTLFDDKLDDNGVASVKADLGSFNRAPGMLNANFMVRAFEEGGDFSTDFFAMKYAPYQTFVGVKLPESGRRWNKYVTDSTYTIDVVTLDENGKPVSMKDLQAAIYQISWRWWWDVSWYNHGSYIRTDYKNLVQKADISTTNGKGSFKFKINYPDWGRYIVEIKDPEGGHSTSEVFYADWPEWVSRGNRSQPEGAKVMTFTTDKETYNVGEKATLTFPSAGQGRALVSIENGSQIKDAYWVTPEPGKTETKFSFEVTEEMTPNIYVHLTYIQPHAQTANDLPIRMYGVQSISVEDPATRINPQIEMPDELAPEKPFTIKISEAKNQPMTYTIAVVDDGLLDLTRFKTPDPWSDFYAKEALGVKTWDMFDYVLGAYGGKLEQLFAIGGDGSELKKTEAKANRFKPVVMFLGPFELEKGEVHEHTLQMPRYVGSVRTMVIAGDKGAYGTAEKTTPVKNPLMILGTLPRVLGPGETVKLPVTVFAMEDKVKNVQVKIETNELLIPEGSSDKSLSFDKPGDDVIEFNLKVPEKVGVGKVSIVATSGKEKATYDIEIQVRNPNPPETNYYETIIQPGDTWQQAYTPVGMEGTNTGMLEVSSIPPVDFGRRLKYLVKYPYGCGEQTTSAAFPQLYLDDVMELDPRMQHRISDNIKFAIEKLYRMQHSNGGFRYWPSAISANDWLSSYAGHFMLEAEKKGYTLPSGFKSRWIKYQKEMAGNWVYYNKDYPNYYYYSHLQQAYRLYTLALAGAPDLSSMNRMREQKGLSSIARWRLAAAYALAGQPEVARELIHELDFDVKEEDLMNVCFGSAMRDKAMILETLVVMGEKDKAAPIVLALSKQLSSEHWYSTQSTAFALTALAKFAGASKLTGNEMDFNYKINGAGEQVKSKLPVSQHEIDFTSTAPGDVSVNNNGESVLYARLLLEGTPLTGDETAAEKKLKIKVTYKTLSGAILDPSKIEQGTDFIAEVEVTNPRLYGYYSNMALAQVFPSGWEIINTRLADYSTAHEKSIPEYRDIRDDRVYTHFGIGDKNTYVVMLNAAYQGRFYLPAVSCEAMYDNSIFARVPGQWVEVVKPGE